jgi:tetratricopeptide (TPR) repeat protein
MHPYGVRDVERLLHLPRSTLRGLIRAGFVSPARGPRRSWLFSFQDLIVLRAAQALATAKVPPKRITRSLKELRRHLPDAMPLSGLAITAVGDRVVVKEGGGRWQADSGQYLLAFDGDPADGVLTLIERPDSPSPGSAGGWFDRGLALEDADPSAAREAYERVIAADPAHLSAQLNLGRLLHEGGRLAEAEEVYRKAIGACGSDSLLLFNLGVLLEDQGRRDEALEAYERALHRDPRLADCHYNLALLCEEMGRPKQAIRHMAQYRRLSAARSD